jgi:hypothetical protein
MTLITCPAGCCSVPHSDGTLRDDPAAKQAEAEAAAKAAGLAEAAQKEAEVDPATLTWQQRTKTVSA